MSTPYYHPGTEKTVKNLKALRDQAIEMRNELVAASEEAIHKSTETAERLQIITDLNQDIYPLDEVLETIENILDACRTQQI